MNKSKQAYLLPALVVIAHAFNHLQMGVMPVLYPNIMEELKLSYIQIGGIRTASSFATGFPQIFISFLRRRFLGKTLIGVGNIILSVMNAVSSITKNFNQFIFCRVIGGIGGSPQHPIGTSILTKQSPERQRGRVLGLNLAAANLASAIAPLFGAAFLISLGWRFAIFSCATPAFIVALVLIFFTHEMVDTDEQSKKRGVHVFSGAFLDAMRDRNVLAISAVRTVVAFRMGVRAFFPLYFINERSIDPTHASILYSIMVIGGVIGPFVWGYIADRVKRKGVVIVILVCSSFLYYSLNFIQSNLMLPIVLFFVGFMVQTVVVQSLLADSANPAFLDEIFGFYFTLGFTLGSISSFLFGYIVETFGFTSAFTYISLVTAVSIVPALFISETRR